MIPIKILFSTILKSNSNIFPCFAVFFSSTLWQAANKKLKEPFKPIGKLGKVRCLYEYFKRQFLEKNLESLESRQRDEDKKQFNDWTTGRDEQKSSNSIYDKKKL